MTPAAAMRATRTARSIVRVALAAMLLATVVSVVGPAANPPARQRGHGRLHGGPPPEVGQRGARQPRRLRRSRSAGGSRTSREIEPRTWPRRARPSTSAACRARCAVASISFARCAEVIAWSSYPWGYEAARRIFLGLEEQLRPLEPPDEPELLAHRARGRVPQQQPDHLRGRDPRRRLTVLAAPRPARRQSRPYPEPVARHPFAAVNLISDPIHGYVELTKRLSRAESAAAGLPDEDAAEGDLLDTAWLQRLRRISQLQSARWVFPTAEHSRFTHGLGVMHEAGLWARALWPSLRSVLPGAADGEPLPSEGLVVETLRIAGLLHDVGHGPFAHFFDDRVLAAFPAPTDARRGGGKRLSHEDLSQLIIERELGSMIRSLRRAPGPRRSTTRSPTARRSIRAGSRSSSRSRR